jgi:hypothetical protein
VGPAVEYLRIHLKKTRATVDGPPLRRIKRYRRRRAAAGAVDRNFDPLFYARRLCESYRRQTFVLCLLAFFAALWRILELFVAEEDLFPDSPNKFLITVDARYTAIDELWRLGSCNWGCTAESIHFIARHKNYFPYLYELLLVQNGRGAPVPRR